MQRNYIYAVAAAIAIAAAIYLVQTGVLTFLKPEPRPVLSGRLHVVATFFPLYDFARAVGGDKIELSLLFIQTPEVASFTPADIQKINNADLVIKNGLGFEPILDDLITASDNGNVAIADTSGSIKSLASDPHIWLNPQNAAIQVATIRDALIATDPTNSEFYRVNATAYIADLEQLDREIADAASRFPKKDFVAFHSAFRYFAARYGLRQVAVIEEFPGKEPSPRYIADVIKTIRGAGVKAIFSEPQFSPRVLEAVARDTGLRAYALDPIETGDIRRNSYLSLMRGNLEVLIQAMR